MRPKIPLKLAKRFRRVCPVWAERIMNDKFDRTILHEPFVTNDGGKWYIGGRSSCIVGEAHGRHVANINSSSSYWCGTCDILSIDIMYVFNSDWIDVLREFLDHYETAHAVEVLA